MRVKNTTLFAHGAKVTSRDGRTPQMSFVVRGRFNILPNATATIVEGDFEGDFRAQGALSSEQMHDDDDERRGEALCPNDLADYKLNAEVMLRGTCHAPPGKAIDTCLVTLSVGEWAKGLQVTGHRAWSDRKLGAVMSAPIPFREMPLGYHYSFGGEGYDANPVGKGVNGIELPNIEDPRQRVRAPSDRPKLPAGFGPINPEWPQRCTKRGKEYGAEYQKTRAPFYSVDFDWRYFHCAPADQQLKGYLRGNEDFGFSNLHPQHPRLVGKLPGVRVRVFYRLVDGPVKELPMSIDTLFIDADAQQLLLTWRGLADVAENDMMDVKTALVVVEPLDLRREADAYHKQLEAFEADPLGLQEPGIKELLEQRDAGLEKLDKTMAAIEEMGTHGEDALPDDVERVLSAADADPHVIDKAKEGIVELIKVRKERRPDDTDYATQLLEQKAARKPAAPPPFVIPEPGKPLPMPPMPELTEAVESVLSNAEKADVTLAEQLDQIDAQHLPDEIKNQPSIRGQLGPLEEMMASELFEGLRAPPFVEPGPGLDLSRQDYRGWDLRGRDLSGCDLRQASLAHADLRGANLRGANLDHAVFYKADLREADLTDCTMKLTNLTESNAQGAVLVGVVLDITFFDDADLSEVDFSGCRANRALMRRTTLTKAVLRNVDMFESLFDAASLKQADFSEATLRSCLFQKCELTRSSFQDASLTRTSFFTSDATGANFEGARGDRVVFLKAVLDNCDFGYTTLPNSFFNEASAKRARFFGANLKEARFYRSTLDHADFERANLFRADLRKSMMNDVSLVKANLFEASLLDAAGMRCDFTGANLIRCRTTA